MTAPTPIVTIIIGTCNRADRLPEAVDSVLAQTYAAWELLIVDDGSTDATPDIAAEYARREPRIRLLRQERAGVASARNAGLASARGELVAFLDDDDLWLPQKLARQVARFHEAPGLGLLYTRCHVTRDGALIEIWPPKTMPANFRELVDRNFGPALTVMARRACLQAVGGFDVALPTSEDYDLWLRVAARYPVEGLPDITAVYRLHRTNKSANLARRARIHERIFRKWLDAPPEGLTRRDLIGRIARGYVECGSALKRAGDYRGAAAQHIRAVLVDPLVGLRVWDPEFEGKRLTALSRVLKPYREILYGYWKAVAGPDTTAPISTAGHSRSGSKTNPDAALIAALRRRLDDVLRPLVPPGSRCALLGFPDHANVGDSALWLGQLAWLRRNGVHVAYVAHPKTLTAEQLVKRLGPDGVILLQGGGNLGDLWPDGERFHQHVVCGFPQYRIVQLPQSIHFARAENLERARAVYRAHARYTLLVRDQQSLRAAQDGLGIEATLCPDMAFGLGALPSGSVPRTDVLWLSRTDHESAGHVPPLHPGVESVDWLADGPSWFPQAHQQLFQQFREHPRALRGLIPLWAAGCAPVARMRLARGCRLLGRGRVVVTDRLHGHILSLLLGIPHVIFDNNYGKLRSFFQTWTKDSAITRWAESGAQALDLARGMART